MSVVDKIQLRRNGPYYDIRDNTKAPLVHNHDDRYYTESEVDSKESDIYDAVNSKLPLSGGTITGNLTVNSNIYGDVGHGIQTGGFIRQDIDSNSNLNTYTSPGFYKCTQNSTAETLTNCPTGLAFTLDIINSTGHSPDATNYQYLTQKLTTYLNDLYLRRGQGDYGGTITWESWGLIAYHGNTVVARPSYEPSIDRIYDAATFITNTSSSGTFPSGATKYGAGLTLPYRKPYGNQKPDFAGQIYIPNGDTTPNSMYFRTSKANTWDAWNKVATESDESKIVRVNKYTLPVSSTVSIQLTSNTLYIVSGGIGATASVYLIWFSNSASNSRLSKLLDYSAFDVTFTATGITVSNLRPYSMSIGVMPIIA